MKATFIKTAAEATLQAMFTTGDVMKSVAHGATSRLNKDTDRDMIYAEMTCKSIIAKSKLSTKLIRTSDESIVYDVYLLKKKLEKAAKSEQKETK